MECDVSPTISCSSADDVMELEYDDDIVIGIESHEDVDMCDGQDDPEYIDFVCLDYDKVRGILNETTNFVVNKLKIGTSLAKFLLYKYNWDGDALMEAYNSASYNLLIDCHVISSAHKRADATCCAVCTRWQNECEKMFALDCGHTFCASCWLSYVETQLSNGISTTIGCMASGCAITCLEDFILRILHDSPELRAKYEELMFKNFVISHPRLRFCPGMACDVVIMTDCKKAKKVTCSKCSTSFCFRCGSDYHAPTSCEVMRKWLIKCADDSETANYISAHTKDCPNCHSCIEKNGGCNHMQCAKCKHHFCWMCFGEWKNHGNEYYECSRYKENPAVAQEANHLKARRALEKYLHYYERYENHHKSLKLEEELRSSIKRRIDEKVNGHEGTWIDWQYLHKAATLLTKCRYTLQHTYPYAYYMENGPRKHLFEYQQAQLEKEIEELSWKVERAESTERGDLESQMHVAECKRRTLLQDFFE